MKPFWVLLLLTIVPGCANFEDYTYSYEDAGPAAFAPASCGCQSTPTTGTVSAATGLVPTVTALPSVQTREPDLAPTRR